jgi:N-acetylglutamate synthase-like GNAT family acetyltransferase
VFKTDNRVVAIVEVIANSLFLLIENLAVSPAEQGKGIGAVLLNHILELVRSMGPSQMRLYTHSTFIANIAFFQARGFDGFLKEPLAAGGEAVHMNRAVDGTSPHHPSP